MQTEAETRNSQPLIGREAAAFAMIAYRRMAFIRAFERRCLDLSATTPAVVAGSMHFCAGQEAIPVGAAAALGPDDRVVATYRGHGWALESGITPFELLGEVCHRATGINGGRAGSAYIMAPDRGFLGENSIVGAGVPIACGAAMAARLRGTGGIVLVSFGDGATSQGAVHEGMVFAAARSLPIIFLCEANGWSEMTPTSDIVRVDRLASRAAGYGIPSATIDGGDPIAVRETIRQAAESARASGPSFIECRTVRLWGHYNRDIEHYRPAADRAEAGRRDPLLLLQERLLACGIASGEALAEIRREVDGEIEALTERVLAAATPSGEGARDHVVATPQQRMPTSSADRAAPKEMTYIEAVNAALRTELESRPDVLVYGEDVGNAGGIFGATRYLQRDFGKERVFDTPIAESAILGSAVGAAICGLRPIVEIMWADFMLVALDQLINQAANVRYVSRGNCNVPMVVRMQQGATPGSCAQHSQSLEALLAHIPGLRVGLPSTPQDAYDMLRAAVADPDPCIIIEARALYQRRGLVDLGNPVQPVGGSRTLRAGPAVAIISWGTMVGPAVAAADELDSEGIDTTVIDMRWVSPLDDAAIDSAVGRCGGRIIIAHEANQTGGVGAEIAARILERHAGIAAGLCRIAAPDIRMPASPELQQALLPNKDAIVAVARRLARAGRQKPASPSSKRVPPWS